MRDRSYTSDKFESEEPVQKEHMERVLPAVGKNLPGTGR